MNHDFFAYDDSVKWLCVYLYISSLKWLVVH